MKTHLARTLHIVGTALAGVLLSSIEATAADLAVRVFDRSPDVRNLDTADTLKWYADESIDYTVRPRRAGNPVAIPVDAVATWIVADSGTGTNYLSIAADSQTGNSVTFRLPLGGAALPEGGDWVSFVTLHQGTNYLGVIDRCRAECLWAPYTAAAALTPTNPLPELLRRFATSEWVEGLATTLSNALHEADAAIQDDIAGIAGDLAHQAEEIAGLEEAVGGLWGETAGGFRWPDYFAVRDVEAGVAPGTVTNAASATQEVFNVRVETVSDSRLKGWRIDTEIIRQQDWEAGVEWEALEGGIEPADLAVDGDVVHFAEWVEGVSGDFAVVRGTLGGYVVEMDLEFDSAKQSTTSTVLRFAGPAAGSLLAACWSNVLGAASNGYAAGKSVALRTWPEGYGTYKHNTNIVQAGWDTNFWGAGLGDFSCISYWSQGPDGWDCGVYRPITMVTPRHGIVANHYKPPVGSNCCWVTRGGGVVTNRVVDYRRVRGDLTVARLETAFSTNDVAPAKLLGNGWHSYLYGAAEAVSGLFGVPVIGYDCAERGYVTPWMPTALNRGRGAGVGDDGTFGLGLSSPDIPFFRRNPVGGDSGSPVFWPIDGNTVLIGCWHATGGGPLPTKAEVDEAIEAWGDEERCAEYDLVRGGWENPDAPGAPGM